MAAVTDPTGPAATAGVDTLSLVARDITVRFGGLTALSSVSIEVAPRSVVGLVGSERSRQVDPAGVLSGLLRPNGGEVWLRGENVTHTSIRSRAARGLARTFQQPELFMGLTVREHLVLAHRARVAPSRLWRDMIDPRSLLPASKAENERVDGLLELLRLTRVAKAPRGRPPPGRHPSSRGRSGPGQRSPRPAARRASLRPRHQRLGEPAVGVPAHRGP